MSNSWIEWRAIYQVPASLLDSKEALRRGYVERKTRPFQSKKDAEASARYRSEETLAVVVGYETRTVQASEWSLQ